MRREKCVYRKIRNNGDVTLQMQHIMEGHLAIGVSWEKEVKYTLVLLVNVVEFDLSGFNARWRSELRVKGSLLRTTVKTSIRSSTFSIADAREDDVIKSFILFCICVSTTPLGECGIDQGLRSAILRNENTCVHECIIHLRELMEYKRMIDQWIRNKMLNIFHNFLLRWVQKIERFCCRFSSVYCRPSNIITTFMLV